MLKGPLSCSKFFQKLFCPASIRAQSTNFTSKRLMFLRVLLFNCAQCKNVRLSYSSLFNGFWSRVILNGVRSRPAGKMCETGKLSCTFLAIRNRKSKEPRRNHQCVFFPIKRKNTKKIQQTITKRARKAKEKTNIKK